MNNARKSVLHHFMKLWIANLSINFILAQTKLNKYPLSDRSLWFRYMSIGFSWVWVSILFKIQPTIHPQLTLKRGEGPSSHQIWNKNKQKQKQNNKTKINSKTSHKPKPMQNNTKQYKKHKKTKQEKNN